MKKINFKQPKYIIPTIAYFGLLLVGWLFIDLFSTEVKDVEPSNLQTTEYLNSDLPAAHVPKEIGSKRQNVRNTFGDISDLSAVQDFMENPDTTVNKKEDFHSQYSEEEKRFLAERAEKDSEIKRLREMNEALQRSAANGSQMGSSDFVIPMTEEERARALAMRRNGMMAELDRDLNNARTAGVASIDAVAAKTDSIRSIVKEDDAAVRVPDDNADNNVVIKKSKDESEYFNTLSSNEPESHLIKAIIDEDIKAVDGSRVRLRLLDDIEVSGSILPKGTYLFATMSGFGSQRVKGQVSTVLIGDEIVKIGLSIYDVSDGLEGLYVPESNFRETAKDIGSSAMQGNMQVNSGYGGSSLTQWAGQALQNGVQRTTNAISKAIKKNRVKLKYGTQVYLINSKQEKKR